MFSLQYRDTGELRRFRQELPRIARRVVVHVAADAVLVAKDAILRRWNVPAESVDAGITVTQSNDSTWWGGIDNPKASVIARGRRIPLLAFAAQQTPTGVSFEIKKGRRQTVAGAFITQTLRGYGRKGGKSKRAMKAVLKNLKRQKAGEQAAARAESGSVALRRSMSASSWGAKASRASQRYAAATQTYQAQRALLTSMGAFRVGVFKRKGKKRLPIKALYGGSVQAFFASMEVGRELRRFCTGALGERMDAEVSSFFGGQ